MNADETELTRKKQRTASITCLVAGVMIIVSLFMPRWLTGKAQGGALDLKVSLFTFEACGKVETFDSDKPVHKCESMSNAKFVDELKKDHQSANGLFPILGWVVLVVGLISGLAALAAGGLGLRGKFIRDPIAVTSVLLVGAMLALVVVCVWVAIKPGYVPHLGPILGLSWPFFVFGVGVLAGIAGAQMLAKAHSNVRDPYWDGVGPEPQ